MAEDFTSADVDAVNAHLREAGVVESTEFGDQKTTFRSLDETLKLRALMKRDANAATNGSRTRSRFAAFNKGI